MHITLESKQREQAPLNNLANVLHIKIRDIKLL